MRKKCKDCFNYNSLGVTDFKHFHDGRCEVDNRIVHEGTKACTTDFKPTGEYGTCNRPIIFKLNDDEGSELILRNIDCTSEYIDLLIEDANYESASVHLTREDLKLLAHNILDYLDGKEIKYPSVKIKNNDF